MKTANRISDIEDAIAKLEKAAEKIGGPMGSARPPIVTELDVDAAAQLILDAVTSIDEHLDELNVAYANYLCVKAQSYFVFWFSDRRSKLISSKRQRSEKLNEHIGEAFDCIVKASTALFGA